MEPNEEKKKSNDDLVRGMGPNNEKKKKINDDLIAFMRKRSETEAPRYTARLKSYVDLQLRKRRAAMAREHYHHEAVCGSRKTTDGDPKIQTRTPASNDRNASRRSLCGMSGEHPGSEDSRVSRSRRTAADEKNDRSISRSSRDPSDRCCRRRRRRRRPCCRRKRRRSCSRRRRRSSRRRRCRRRRRSCSRRRRRRSCRRRRRRRRRRC